MNKQETIAYLETAISEISERLKRPMSDIIRAMMVADRKDMREELAKLKAEE